MKRTATPLQLIQAAELDVAKFLNDPFVPNVLEYFQSVQDALCEAIDALGGAPLALTCPHCGRDLEGHDEIDSGLCSSDDCPRHD